jgi:uncharacterized membrane protein YdjX (TVP38/TMEM64 family)
MLPDPHSQRNVMTDTALAVRVLGSPWVRIAILTALLAAAGMIALTTDIRSLDGLRTVIDGMGPFGPIAFVIVYAVAMVVLLPGTPFTVAAGVLFGPVFGSFVALIGATIGATLAFTVGRAIGRRAVEQVTGRRVATIDRFLADRGFVAILMVRLIPLFPFNVVNLVSGVTGLTRRDYVLGTAVGIIPGTVLLAAMGGSIDDPTSPTFIAAALGFVALTVVASLVARRMRTRGRLQAAEVVDEA